ncbi:Mitochondrial import inner membrane translocase subunit Tim21 [Linderina pennispora]|nr:Mitochondrial import inner membrane translocase subunit Tim21 [Linderina pennispora]
MGNLLIVGSVVGMFGYIVYVLYDNMFAEHGVTRVYNESLDLVRANPEITGFLGSTISGFGEPTHSQRQRQRSIAHREFVDPQGRKRMTMKYYAEDAHHVAPYLGVVKVDLAESPVTKSWDFNYIVVDMYQKQNGAVGGEPIGRVEVLLTEEFAKEVREFQNKARNRRFSTDTKGSSDGSWFSVLHPSNWRQ